MSAEPHFPDREPETRGRHLSLVQTTADETDTRARTPRALVPEAAPKNSRKFIITVFAMVPLILILILLVNIVTASRQYDLVDLRTREETLTQQNEALSQEIEYHQAPQDLAIRASQLGLVSTSVPATLNLQTGEITGTPSAVTKDDKDQKNLISPPSLGDTDASAVASDRAAEQEKKEAEARASASASASAASSDDREEPSAQQGTAGSGSQSSAGTGNR